MWVVLKESLERFAKTPFCRRTPVRASHIGGYYVDELVRTDEGWKLQAIQYNALYEEGDRSLVEQAAANVSNQN